MLITSPLVPSLVDNTTIYKRCCSFCFSFTMFLWKVIPAIYVVFLMSFTTVCHVQDELQSSQSDPGRNLYNSGSNDQAKELPTELSHKGIQASDDQSRCCRFFLLFN